MISGDGTIDKKLSSRIQKASAYMELSQHQSTHESQDLQSGHSNNTALWKWGLEHNLDADEEIWDVPSEMFEKNT